MLFWSSTSVVWLALPARSNSTFSLGHERSSRHVGVMSVIPLKADIHRRGLHVRFVPEADVLLTS